ncbi:hypothetical protein PF002_g3692 [Phytophthora fragariae]|nr:hypothetical protein PF003_g26835 [Phytophthora fragariae]KAE9252691.1 hypothetical protein PF002_g3692 [Phytophthora fragariae]
MENPANTRNYFNLSLQTLSSTGYGALYPANTCSRWIAVIEYFVSMLLTSFLTGILFVKFARPHPNIVISDVFTVSRGENNMEMHFRVANETRRDLANKGDIIDVHFKLILMRVETGRHDEKRLCYYDLKLKSARLVSLRLEVELIHIIDTNSPFFKQTADHLAHADFVLILLASGLDENLHDMVHKKLEYGPGAMRWNSKFIPMLDWDARHQFIELDLDKISAVSPIPNVSDSGRSINIDVTSASMQEEDNDGRVDHGNQRNSNGFQTEDTIPHKLADGSTWELSDDYDKEATIKRRGDHASGGAEPDSNSTSNGEEDNDEGFNEDREAQRRNSRLSRSAFSYQDHDHHLAGNLNERPMSLLQRRVRVRSRSRCVLLNGMYQQALAASWPSLLLSLVVVYLAVVDAIALLMTVSVHEPLRQRTQSDFLGKYEMVFFFCVQTISTVGYGSLSPRQDSDAANFFVFLLVFSGLFVSALLAGITWAKFSIPKASTLLYSDVLLFTSFHSHRAVMFRAANNRKYGVLVEGSFRMSVVVLNRNFGRRETHELRLVRNVWPIINLCNTLTHIVDESSPLFHLSTDELLSGDHFFVVLFTGLDNIISETMVARKAYHACDILVDHHFEDNITLTADGLYIDLDAINATYFDPNVAPEQQPSDSDDISPSSSPTNPEAIDSPRSSFQLLSD